MSGFAEAVLEPYSRFDHSRETKARQPLLAHYTSLHVIEQMIANNEIWLSNPLHMNDRDELIFGVDVVDELLAQPNSLRQAFGSDERWNKFQSCYHHYVKEFDEKLALDVYAFCLSEHDADDFDGRLSMWRGYGASGNGAAVVFATASAAAASNESVSSVLYLAPVAYGDRQSRVFKFRELVDDFAGLVSSHAPSDDEICLVAFHLLQCTIIQSLLTKHKCFDEEREWRLIYMRHVDDENELTSDLSYHIGPQGPEPKLKFRVRPVRGMDVENLTLSSLIDRIIVGPGNSTPLAVASFKRVVELKLGVAFSEKVYGSSIPFRPHR